MASNKTTNPTPTSTTNPTPTSTTNPNRNPTTNIRFGYNDYSVEVYFISFQS
jgi:hypothetical protein